MGLDNEVDVMSQNSEVEFHILQNPEWKSMFGSNSSDKSLSTSPKSKTLTKPEAQALRKPSTPSVSQVSSTGSLVNVSQLSISSSVTSKTDRQQTIS